MSRKPNVPPAERTPLAQLSEAGMHAIMGYQLAQASIVTNRVFDECVGHHGSLRRVEFTLLALVQGNPDVTARQLARALGVTPPNIAVWIERLESRGLVTRTRGDRDARLQHIRATPAGAALVDRSLKRLLEGERSVLSSLTTAEHGMLIELLHKVARSRKRTDASD